MNPVITFHDFLEYMEWSTNTDKLVPILLIKPSTILLLNQDHRINHMFDYYDRRSGEVQFFLPGYAHYPSLSFMDVFPNHRPFNSDAIALHLTRLRTIYYSDNDFIDFIETIEHFAPSFRYYGNTELLFLKYISKKGSNHGRFDFSDLHRYNISDIYHSNPRSLEHILEAILHAIKNSKNDSMLIEEISELFQLQS